MIVIGMSRRDYSFHSRLERGRPKGEIAAHGKPDQRDIAQMEVIEDGWFKSGDLGYLDENGEIRVADRKKECINTGGEKVFPLEVEEVLSQHPKVDDVCVIGVPDEEWGNTIRAVVQLKPGQMAEGQEIRDFCRGKLAGYKIPRTCVFADELPHSPVGKMLRQKIRELYGKA